MVPQNKYVKILLCGRMDRNQQCNVGRDREVKPRKCPETPVSNLHKKHFKSLEELKEDRATIKLQFFM